jgi:hypothetical protein
MAFSPNQAGEVPMSSAQSSIQSKSARRWAIEEPTEEPCWATEDLSFPPADNDQLRSERLPPGSPASRVLGRFLITFCIGVAATLAWQSFGDVAREMIANSSPRLGWMAPPAAPVAEVVPAAPSSDQEELKAIWLGLAGVRQRVDQIAAQLAAGQEQMTRDINKLQAAEQDILDKISAPPPRPATTPAHKPAAPTPLPLTLPEAQLVR